MQLEQGLDGVSAKWNKDTNQWDIGQRKMYRWSSNDRKKPMSQWFYDIDNALVWIKEYDQLYGNKR